jgi:general secretion pathway protein G
MKYKQACRMRAFTLVEMMISLTLISILILTFAPKSKKLNDQARAAVLKQNLLIIRNGLDRYYKINSKYPVNLNELVNSGILTALPEDPFMGSGSSWETVLAGPDSNEIENIKSRGDYTDNTGTSIKDY